jgi:hypothetical protein
VNKKNLLPLVAMLIATPLWARQHSTAGTLTFSTTALSFNGSSGNESSQPLTVTVTGSGKVTVTSVSFSNTVFSTGSVPLPVTLSSGQSITGQVSARPQTTAQTGKLTIGSSAGTFTVSLSETAIAKAPAAHSASLTWKAPSAGSDAVDSYQVDRAPSGATDYTTIGTTTAGSTTYSDNSVQSGQTYVYEIRSVDQDGNSSDPSNSVTLSIP